MRSDEFAGQLTEVLEADLERSDPMREERWRGRGPVQRLAESASKLLRREL